MSKEMKLQKEKIVFWPFWSQNKKVFILFDQLFTNDAFVSLK